jgi:hypothetical protein
MTRQVGGFLLVLRFPPPIKTDRYVIITGILLKVALNTITHNLYCPLLTFLGTYTNIIFL